MKNSITQLIKNLLYILLLCSTSFQLEAQDQDSADSLYAIWSDTTNHPVVRLEAFNERFTPFKDERGNPEIFRWAMGSEEAFALIEKTGQTHLLGKFLMMDAAKLGVMGEVEKGLERAEEALHKSLELQDYSSALWSWFMLSTSSSEYLKLDEEIMQELISGINTENFGAELRGTINLLGEAFFLNSQFPEALSLYQKVIDLSEELNLRDGPYSSALSYKGTILRQINSLEEAEKFLQKRLILNKERNVPLGLGSSYAQLAHTFLAQKDLEKATTYLDSAVQVMKGKEECIPCLLMIKIVRAGIDNQLGQHQKALQALLKIRENHSPLINTLTISEYSTFYRELGNTYLGLGQFQKAIEAAETSIGTVNGNLYSSQKPYKILSQAKEALGDHKAALEDYKKYISIRDTITVLRNSQEVTRLDLENQFEKKRLADSLLLAQQQLESELVFQEELNRQKTNRNIGVGIGIVALLMAIGLFSRLRFIRKTQAALKEKNKIIEAEKEKAKASERAKHQFLANMSHEIRTPMNAIKGMTDILLRREPKQEQMEYLEGIKQSSDSLLVIINDILDLSKIEAGKIELEQVPFSVEEIIKDVQTIMQFKAEEKGLELKTSIPEDILPIKGDPNRLRQILLNLVGNAIKFTEKGMVTVQVKKEDLSDHVTQLKFSVSDTGVGIDTERLEKIFQSFEQAYTDTSRKFGGTGLGLSISKKLVDLHGGEIWVDSEKGKGSQFHFTIPFEKVAAPGKAPTATPIFNTTDLAAHLKGIRILLVEDNDFNALVAREELEDAIEEVQVAVAENGAIAVEKVKMDDFEVILMDVQMPVMNGYEATEKIRSMGNEKSSVPIIAMTANVMKDEVDRCYEAGMDDFIGKPFDTGELLSKIHQLQKQAI
jgi:signal transduction histidine kinase/CheY-like chemotaxis protein